jgi:hypothetical protein
MSQWDARPENPGSGVLPLWVVIINDLENPCDKTL